LPIAHCVLLLASWLLVLPPNKPTFAVRMDSKTQGYSQIIKAQAKALGFDFCGISKAEFLEQEAPRLEKWLKENKHGKMQYMENYFDKRLDPRLLVDGAKSVVSLLYNYYPHPKPAARLA
jgi:epoxyqueuosine reductase